jgi:chromosome segregation ATPase
MQRQHAAQKEIESCQARCIELARTVNSQDQQIQQLRHDLELARSERDDKCTENFRLKAEKEVAIKNQIEFEALKERYMEYEKHGIRQDVAAIEQRDGIIEDLSNKLEQVLNQLELERKQFRQRRQIIFPRQQERGHQHNG